MLHGNTSLAKGTTHHECVQYKEGDWIVLVCRTCQDYEKRYNWRTGEIKVRHGKVARK